MALHPRHAHKYRVSSPSRDLRPVAASWSPAAAWAAVEVALDPHLLERWRPVWDFCGSHDLYPHDERDGLEFVPGSWEGYWALEGAVEWLRGRPEDDTLAAVAARGVALDLLPNARSLLLRLRGGGDAASSSEPPAPSGAADAGSGSAKIVDEGCRHGGVSPCPACLPAIASALSVAQGLKAGIDPGRRHCNARCA